MRQKPSNQQLISISTQENNTLQQTIEKLEDVYRNEVELNFLKPRE